MITRRLGRTEREISVAVLGGAAFAAADAETCARTFETALAAGVNALDIAPSYGHAQALVGQVLPAYRSELFVACKTLARDRDGARRELEESLSLLGTDHLDLYQLHAVTTPEELAAALAPGGAAETLVEAKAEGLVSAIGITGHFRQAAALFREALERVDLDTVMLPLNAAMLRLEDYRRDFDALLDVVEERNLGVIAIKAVAKGPWTTAPHYATWYEPHDASAEVQRCVDFVLSWPITAFAMPGDVRLLPTVLAAVQAVTRQAPEELQRRISTSHDEALAGF